MSSLNVAAPSLRLALLICAGALLVACGRSDPDSRTLPAPAGSVGAMGSGTAGGASPSGKNGSPDQGGPARNGSVSGDPQDEDGSGDDEDDGSWPALRKVPGGTLTWLVTYKGNGTTETSEHKEAATLSRQMEGRAHMVGSAGNPRKHIARPLDDISKAMDACGDDTACQQAAAMRAVARMQQNPDAIERGMENAQAEYQRDTIWGADSCTAKAKADDKAVWSGMTSEGFNTGVATRRGGQALEDCTVQIEEGDVRPSLVADDASKTYQLALPPGEIRVTGTLAGRVEPTPRRVSFPPLLIKGIKYDSLDKPLSGSATVHMGAGKGIWSEGWAVPLTEEVSWTFTPDGK